MLFPLYTHVRVPEGAISWQAKWADKLNKEGKPVAEVGFLQVKESFDGVIVKTLDKGAWYAVELRPSGDHTKIENPATGETYMFLDSMVKDKITRL